MKIFMFFYNLHTACEKRLKSNFGDYSTKKRAGYALLSGIGRAGVYFFS